AGMAQIAEATNIKIDDFVAIKDFCKKNAIDLVVIGPEAPLVAGLSDFLQEEGISVFGPRKNSAMIEGSKTFAKEIMVKNSIPTAVSESFTDKEKAVEYVKGRAFPQVIKADGLAAGKGVIIVENLEGARQILEEIFVQNKFGSAGNRVVVEEFIEGQEVSLLAFTDGVSVTPMVEAQDYKPIYDDDKGPNTGGMGCYSPVPAVSSEIYHSIVNDVIEPTVFALASQGCIYQGVLYAGVILTEKGPKVLEFNARFGDPETQVILPRMKSDLLEILQATANRELGKVNLDFSDEVCLSVVIASGGYPQKYKTDYEIEGIKEAEQAGAVVFHAGTIERSGKIYTNGGRVLNVTVLAKDFKEARDIAYKACSSINFKDKYHRNDIGLRTLEQYSYSKSR
ncbi:MAG: phosphoribosylamine--glycine ligase, partial [Actinobacteria bacterium]